MRRLHGLEAQLRSRRTHAARLLTALPKGGRLAELGYGEADHPNYYSLVLTAQPPSTEALATWFAGAGLPPDSVRTATSEPRFASSVVVAVVLKDTITLGAPNRQSRRQGSTPCPPSVAAARTSQA